MKENILSNLNSDCIEIVQDPFGNYAIQFAIEQYGVEDCFEIVQQILCNIVLLANQKFSSNVVEKCIESGFQVKVF